MFVVLWLVFVSHFEYWNSKATETLHYRHFLVIFKFIQEPEQAGVGIWYAVGEIDSIVGDGEVIGEGHGKICV